MKPIAVTVWLPLVMLFTLTLPACEREAPQKPLGTATNKHVEESPASMAPTTHTTAEGMTGAVKSSIEKAYEAEGALQGAAETTSKQAEQPTQ
jgi:hypothetical protein